MKTDIVLIDSGVNSNHSMLKNCVTSGLNLTGQGDLYDTEDKIGHGTAVYYLLHKFAPNAKILPLKIFDNEFSTDFERLVYALEYVYNNIDCKIIHLSNGITYCDNIQYFYDICNKIREKNIIIVAAFNNGGAISYPAAFSNVIGVDWSKDCHRFSEYEYFEGSIINFRGIGTEVRVPWLGNAFNLVGGSSFATPYITALVYQYINDGLTDISMLCEKIKEKAKRHYVLEKHLEIGKMFSIESAVVFPFNKEIHSLLRFEDLLCFKIHKIYNSRYFGNTNKSITEATGGALVSDRIIYDYEKIDWESEYFDCFILGHTAEIKQVSGKNYIEEIIEKCIKYKKNLYCFDDLSSYIDKIKEETEEIKIFYPHIISGNVPKENCGKLRHIGKPVIGIFGTSPRQGKYTLQLTLRKRFMEDGYKVGQLGTEPTAPLFGFDACYPMGYSSAVHINGTDAISVINMLLGEIEDANPDIILVGAQSQTIPLSTGNIGLYTLNNQELLLACEPDICLLCVNYNDEINYIKRTIQFIESYVETKVLALVLFPVERNLRWSVFGNANIIICEEDLLKRKDILLAEVGLPVFLLGDDNNIEELYQQCLSFFDEDE